MEKSDYVLAKIEYRIIAYIIDLLIWSFVIRKSGLYLFGYMITRNLLDMTVGTIGIIAGLLYMFSADGLMKGQSVGKRVMRICMIDEKTGRPCTFWQSLIRNSLLVFLGVIDCIFIFSHKQQRLGDILAKTIVINK